MQTGTPQALRAACQAVAASTPPYPRLGKGQNMSPHIAHQTDKPTVAQARRISAKAVVQAPGNAPLKYVPPAKVASAARRTPGGTNYRAIPVPPATPTQVIKLLVPANPKRPDTQGWRNFNLYKNGMTRADFLAKGGTGPDIAWDYRHGFISLDGKAAPTAK